MGASSTDTGTAPAPAAAAGRTAAVGAPSSDALADTATKADASAAEPTFEDMVRYENAIR
jgi:hypothetical protein